MRSLIFVVALISLGAVCDSQMLLKSEDVPTISKVLDTFHGPNSLKCSVLHEEPKLDFNFRWIVMYKADCSSSKLRPEERLVAYIRLQPRGGEPIYFVDPQLNVVALSLPEGHIAVTDPALNYLNSRAIAVGGGEYSVDFLVGSTNRRMFRKQWSFRTKFGKFPQLAGLPPNSAEVFNAKKWIETLTPDAPRLSILLHATVLHRHGQDSVIAKSNTITTDEESYWLSSLTALLAHVPHRSVDITAFSIEHQKEIFRQQDFNEEGYRQLSEVLSKEEIGKTVVPAAMQSETLARFLAGLVKQDETVKDTDRLVIFLGPTAWLSHLEIPKDFEENFRNADTRLFYFQYYDPSLYGRDNLQRGHGLYVNDSDNSAPRYPKDGIWKGDKTSDSIDYLVKALGGETLRVHSAEEFRQAIGEMLERSKLSSR